MKNHMTRIICVAAGQSQTKKYDNPINRRHRYLNYGLLALASVLERSGCDPVVLHGHFDSPFETLELADSLGLSECRLPLLLSVPSYYAVSWAREFVQLAKAKHPRLRVVIGGRWVVGEQPDQLHQLIPEADQIVAGLGDGIISDIVGVGQRIHIDGVKGGHWFPGGLPPLNYRLLHNRKMYQPSLEVARGCGMGCGFCQERDAPLQSLKPAHTLVDEFRATLLHDDLLEMTPYLETSMFVPTSSWAHALAQQMDASALAVRWRTEGRVDNIQPELLPLLAKAGLKVLDLGLESASTSQLQRMKKTRSPAKYLNRAAHLLDACARNGIMVKVNLLLYAGESEESIAETLNWLDARRELIFGVSVGLVIVFGWPNAVSDYLAELEKLGSTVHHSPCPGVTHLNLSPHIDHELACILARKISRRYMSANHYYQLKSFSYFARDYSFGDFLSDARASSRELSFHLQEYGAEAIHLVGATT